MNNSYVTDIGNTGRHFLSGLPSKSLSNLTILCLLVLLVSTGWLGFITYAPYGLEAAIGIATGTVSVVAMAVTLLLATRLKILEPLFGGLDKMYRVHKWLGISAMVFMVLHELIEPDFERAVRETALGEVAEEAGELVFYVLLALVALSWFRRLPFIRLEIPYQLWRFSHRFMGILFAIVAFHQFYIDMPGNVDPLLTQVLDVFCIAGITAWFYIELIAPRLRKRDFIVREMTPIGDSLQIELFPKGRKMSWQAGQFVFASSPEAGLAEAHPFTITNAPNPEGKLVLSIKSVGDWTRRLPSVLEKGMKVRIEGPYGRFNFRKGAKRQVWLAGGIGITPFLSWSESLSEHDKRNIHLVVSLRYEEEKTKFLPLLQAARTRHKNFSFEVITTQSEGRLTATRLIQSTPFDISTADLWFCGPSELRLNILNGLAEVKQTPQSVHFEHFEFA